MSVFAFIIMIVGLVTLGEVMSKFFEGRSERPAALPRNGEEMERLRERVDELTDRVERLTEEQRFMTRLLESSSSAAAIPPQRDPGGGRAPGPQNQDTD